MKLREIIRELVNKKFKTQTALAEALNPLPRGIERAKPADVQRMASAGRNQEKQFAIFMRLLPMCKEIGVDPAQNLELAEAEKGGLRYVEQEVDNEAGKAVARRQRRGKKKAVSGFSAGRIKGS